MWTATPWCALQLAAFPLQHSHALRAADCSMSSISCRHVTAQHCLPESLSCFLVSWSSVSSFLSVYCTSAPASTHAPAPSSLCAWWLRRCFLQVPRAKMGLALPSWNCQPAEHYLADVRALLPHACSSEFHMTASLDACLLA